MVSVLYVIQKDGKVLVEVFFSDDAPSSLRCPGVTWLTPTRSCIYKQRAGIILTAIYGEEDRCVLFTASGCGKG